MMPQAEWQFAKDHPTAAGHFPGNPIIPGALLLDGVVAAIAGTVPGALVTIRAAKFLAPVRPGDAVTLRWEASQAGSAKFEISLSHGKLAASGVLDIGQVAA